MRDADALAVADVYRDTGARITEILTGADTAAWLTQVPACPGWSVRDVLSHMTAVGQDWADGRPSGPPTDDETAEHTRRYAGQDESELLGVWSATLPATSTTSAVP